MKKKTFFSKVISILLLTLFVSISSKSQQGASLNFDGIDDNITSTNGIIPVNNSPYSVSIWAQCLSIPQSQKVSLISQGNNFDISIDYQGNLTSGNNVTGISFPTDGNWHNYTVVRTQTDYYFYLDGNLLFTKGSYQASPLPNPINGFGNLIIGADESGSINFFHGNIDESR